MARYARDILAKMEQLTREMEVTLGPDTGDLSRKYILNSLPIALGHQSQ